jgi:hypothetical protein
LNVALSNEVSPFISALTKLLVLRNFAPRKSATPEKVASLNKVRPEKVAPPKVVPPEKVAPVNHALSENLAPAKSDLPETFTRGYQASPEKVVPLKITLSEKVASANQASLEKYASWKEQSPKRHCSKMTSRSNLTFEKSIRTGGARPASEIARGPDLYRKASDRRTEPLVAEVQCTFWQRVFRRKPAIAA